MGARAFETPAQRDLRTAPVEKEVPDWQKYYPGTAPARLEPPKGNKKLLERHAYRAGSFSDIFKQLVVSTMIDLKVKKSENPLWYVETCAGEGEYHASRMRGQKDDRTPQQWPTIENLYEAELYVETPNWDEWSEQPKWRGCGVLISSPPYTTGERIQACLTVLAEE